MPNKAPSPVPQGMSTVTPYFTFRGNCTSAIEFYQKAFGASVVGQVAGTPDGKVMHAMLRIGDSNIMMSDSWRPDDQIGSMLTMWMYVQDADQVFEKALKAGCEVTMPLEDAFWGDRLGQVKDPFGFLWSIASWKWELTADEMQKKQDDWLKGAGSM